MYFKRVTEPKTIDFFILFWRFSGKHIISRVDIKWSQNWFTVQTALGTIKAIFPQSGQPDVQDKPINLITADHNDC
jgi:hypothetical protein